MLAFAVRDTALIQRGTEVQMIGMGGELVEGGCATAEMQISRWRAGDQIPSVPGGGHCRASAVQLHYLVNRYILHSAH